jgi:hypothetical protein
VESFGILFAVESFDMPLALVTLIQIGSGILDNISGPGFAALRFPGTLPNRHLDIPA